MQPVPELLGIFWNYCSALCGLQIWQLCRFF